MASTLDTTTATVTLTVAYSSNEQNLNYSNVLTLQNVIPNDARVMTIPTATEVTVVAFGSSQSAGTFVNSNVRYIQITNKDDTNFIRLRVTKTSGQTFDVKLTPGASWIMTNVKESANTGGGSFTAFVDADNISAQADTSPVDIQYLVLSV